MQWDKLVVVGLDSGYRFLGHPGFETMPRASEHVYRACLDWLPESQTIAARCSVPGFWCPRLMSWEDNCPQSFESWEIRVKRETAAGREMTTRECLLPPPTSPAPPVRCTRVQQSTAVFSSVQLSVSVRSSTQLYIGYWLGHTLA